MALNSLPLKPQLGDFRSFRFALYSYIALISFTGGRSSCGIFLYVCIVQVDIVTTEYDWIGHEKTMIKFYGKSRKFNIVCNKSLSECKAWKNYCDLGVFM